jgi:hypothetical protein
MWRLAWVYSSMEIAQFEIQSDAEIIVSAKNMFSGT